MPRPTDSKSILLRLDAELAESIEGVASVEGRSVSAVIRDAIAAHIEERRSDPAFRKLVRESIKRHERLLERLDRDGS